MKTNRTLLTYGAPLLHQTLSASALTESGNQNLFRLSIGSYAVDRTDPSIVLNERNVEIDASINPMTP